MLVLIVASRDVPVPQLPVRSNCIVQRAGTAEIALEVARRRHPDVIVVTPEFGAAHTVELCRMLRANPSIGRHTPLLRFAFGAPTAGDRLVAQLAGIHDLIRLPISGEKFALTVREFAQDKWRVEADDGLMRAPSRSTPRAIRA